MPGTSTHSWNVWFSQCRSNGRDGGQNEGGAQAGRVGGDESGEETEECDDINDMPFTTPLSAQIAEW